MDSPKKTLVWVGCGDISSSNIDVSQFDEMIFVEALKYVCWELEAFTSKLNCSSMVLNHAVSAYSKETIFYETSDSAYSFLEGEEYDRPPNVNVINTFNIVTTGFEELFSLVDLSTSILTVVCSVPSLSDQLCSFVLEKFDCRSIAKLYLSSQTLNSNESLDDSYGHLLRQHYFFRKSGTLCSSGFRLIEYEYSLHQQKMVEKLKEANSLKTANVKLEKLLDEKGRQLESLSSRLENNEKLISERLSFIESKISEVSDTINGISTIVGRDRSQECQSSGFVALLNEMLDKISSGKIDSDNRMDMVATTLSKLITDGNEEFKQVTLTNRELLTSLEKITSETEKGFLRLENLTEDKSKALVERMETSQVATKKLVTSAHNNSVKQLEDFLSVRDYIDNGNKPLSFHGWPISPDVSLRMVSLLSTGNYHGVLEFGSGTSTALLCRILQRLAESADSSKSIPFYSFDHNKIYFDKTIELLRLHEVSSFVRLNLCELVKEEFNGDAYSYYDCKGVLTKFREEFGNGVYKLLVLVDGPPGATNRHARYPALPIMMEKLGFDRFEVDFLVDDYGRREEKEVVEKWKQDIENAGFKYSNEVVASEKGFSIFSVRCK